MEVVRPGPGRIRGAGRRAGPDRPGSAPGRIRLRDGRPVVTDSVPTPRPEEVPAPATGSWSATASTGRPRSPPGWRTAQVPPRSRPTRWPDVRPIAESRGRPRAPDRLCHGTEAEDLLRRLAPQVLGAVARRYGHFATAEDAAQEALLAAATQWPADGVPGNPRGLADHGRLTPADRPAAQRAGRGSVARTRSPAAALPEQWLAPGRRPAGVESDDTLILLFLCCHPVAVAGLADRADPARGRRPDHRRDRPGVPGARGDHDPAHQPGQGAGSRTAASRSAMPNGPASAANGSRAVLHVLYLIFNEGYASHLRARAAPRGAVGRGDPAGPRWSAGCCPTTARSTGLLALMLLTDAQPAGPHRAGRRADPAGRAGPEPLGRRRRSPRAWRSSPARCRAGDVGPYQLQAAIAAVHDEAASAEATDWPQIAGAVRAARCGSPTIPWWR